MSQQAFVTQRVPLPPSTFSGEQFVYLQRLALAVNNIPKISYTSFAVGPNSNLTGKVGDLAVNIAAGNAERVYFKNSGVGNNTGWVSLATAGGGGGSAGLVNSVTGTTNRVAVSPTTGAPVVNIDSAYTGQTSITNVGTLVAGSLGTGFTKVALALGGTNADLSATGGAHLFLAQASAGAAITVARPAQADITGLTTADSPSFAGITLTNAAAIITSSAGGPFTVNRSGDASVAPDVGFVIHLIGVSGGDAAIATDAYGGASGVAARRANGTATTPTAVTTGNILSFISGAGYETATPAFHERVGLNLLAAESWTDTAQGTYAELFTTPKGSTTQATRLRVTDAGRLLVGDGTADDLANLLQVYGKVLVANLADSTTQQITYRGSDTNWFGRQGQIVSGGTIGTLISSGGAWTVSGATFSATKDISSFPTLALFIGNQYNSSAVTRFSLVRKAAGSTTTDGAVTELFSMDDAGAVSMGALTCTTIGCGAITSTSTIATQDPGSGAGVWKLGKKITGSGLGIVTTNYVEVMIDGVLVKLAEAA